MSELKPQRYKDDRPAEQFQPMHEWSRTHRPGWVYELVRMVMTPVARLPLPHARDLDRQRPGDGPFILAPNHFSNMDHFFAGVYMRRKIRFMAKSQLFFRNPILDYIYRVGGVFPVRRGHHDEEAFITAHSILDRGGCVLIYARAGARAPASSARRSRASAGWRSSPACRWSRSRSTARRACAPGSGSSSPRSRSSTASRWASSASPSPTREQQLEAAEQVFDRVKGMYSALDERGRRGVIAAIREGASAPTPPPTRAHS